MLHEGVGEFGGLGFVVSGDGEFVWKGVETIGMVGDDFVKLGNSVSWMVSSAGSSFLWLAGGVVGLVSDIFGGSEGKGNRLPVSEGPQPKGAEVVVRGRGEEKEDSGKNGKNEKGKEKERDDSGKNEKEIIDDSGRNEKRIIDEIVGNLVEDIIRNASGEDLEVLEKQAEVYLSEDGASDAKTLFDLVKKGVWKGIERYGGLEVVKVVSNVEEFTKMFVNKLIRAGKVSDRNVVEYEMSDEIIREYEYFMKLSGYRCDYENMKKLKEINSELEKNIELKEINREMESIKRELAKVNKGSKEYNKLQNRMSELSDRKKKIEKDKLDLEAVLNKSFGDLYSKFFGVSEEEFSEMWKELRASKYTVKNLTSDANFLVIGEEGMGG